MNGDCVAIDTSDPSLTIVYLNHDIWWEVEDYVLTDSAVFRTGSSLDIFFKELLENQQFPIDSYGSLAQEPDQT